MKKLKAWQVILLIVFYPAGICYLIYITAKKKRLKNAVNPSYYVINPPVHQIYYPPDGFISRPSEIYDRKSKIVSLWSRKWLEIASEEFVVVDLETTGLDKYTDKIVEISAIRYRNCVEVEKFVTLVDPQRPIPLDATGVHHITNSMVRNAPTDRQAIPALLDFLGNSLLAGHNVNFDISFIEVAARLQGFDPQWNYIDSMSVAKRLIPGLPDYRQTTILNALNVKQNRYHRAEDDCRGCAEIILLGINSLL